METVAARIYGAVKEQIIEGRYPPGSRITEQQVAAEFQTSRTPVREAMRLLVTDGFVLFKPNSGTVVREWTSEQMRQVFDTRVLIESEIAAAAALGISDQQLAELHRLQDEIEASAGHLRGGDTTRIGRLNREFHRLLAQASHNERLVAMLASAMEMPIVQQTFRRYTPQQLQRSFGHHRELIDALAARDAPWARSVMSCHIHSAKHAMLESSHHEHH
jgi:DNA-binding GntR family transcriptional regulator